jgi:putative transposase
MLLPHKIALDPTLAQRRHFARGAGIARFAHNWALAEGQWQYQEGLKPNDWPQVLR